MTHSAKSLRPSESVSMVFSSSSDAGTSMPAAIK